MIYVIAALLALGIAGYVLGIPQEVQNLTGSRLTAAQIAQYAVNAGFAGDDLQTAVAIALAESSGNPQAVGDQGTSIGLWQIHFTVHPEFNQAQLTDPQYNANAAYQIYKNRGFGFADWSTYNSGVYAAYLYQAAQGISA